jgi:hypothetical protein
VAATALPPEPPEAAQQEVHLARALGTCQLLKFDRVAAVGEGLAAGVHALTLGIPISRVK